MSLLSALESTDKEENKMIKVKELLDGFSCKNFILKNKYGDTLFSGSLWNFPSRFEDSFIVKLSVENDSFVIYI